MKSLLIILSLSIASHSIGATSESTFKNCISKVYQSASSSNQLAKDTLKTVATGVKSCRQTVATIKKQEQAAKKAANNTKRIAKLKDQLAKLGVK